jgi:opacity protein-like surface antigen
MKKTFSLVVGLFILLMLPVVSLSATPGPYVSSQFGVALLLDSDISDSSGTGTIKFNPGFALGAAGGYNFGMFRVEGEFGYQRNAMDKATACSGGVCSSGSISGNVSAFSGLANGYIDFVNSSPFTPYISGGIGIAYVNTEIEGRRGRATESWNDTVFAYQAGAGVAYAINKHLTIDVKYRYFATKNLDMGGTDMKFANHNVYIGFKYYF